MGDELLLELLGHARRHGASDVLLKVGSPPAFRVDGAFRFAKSDRLTSEHVDSMVEAILAQAGFEGAAGTLRQHDCSFEGEGVGRFRVGIYRERRSLAIALRTIPDGIPTFDELGLPAAATHITNLQRGLVLVVGAAGSGKTTTLAALVGEMNRTRPIHIVTIEDPIEYVHEQATACVSQREVGPDADSFASALRATLRHGPDVIMVGEVRDEETMDIALKASETGHLVLSSLHTPDVERTMGRVLSLVPGMDEAEVRGRLADNLRAVIAQRLVPRAGGQGQRVLAAEVLMGTGTVRESIRRPAHNPPLRELMERGAHPYGMQTFEMALRALIADGLVESSTARASIAP